MELKCEVQTYDWGRYGIDSTVATLMKSANSDFVLDEKKPYAELWIGTHPNGPSYMKELNISLEEYIKQNSKILGNDVKRIFGHHLPFLFKARELHQQYPTIYKDANHKPELAIALTPFEALCGFRPICEIQEFLKILPELRTIIGENKVLKFITTDEASSTETLKTCFHSLMTCDPELVALQLKKLLDRLSNLDESLRQTLHASLMERLHSDYPGDVGCFGIYFFNFITLQPGEAIYLGPNEPHAYLSGECMACSDNVVRAGLTPKLKDVPTLVEILSYTCDPISAKKFQPSREDECTEIFRPPVIDFAVAKITGEISPSKILCQGSVVFIPANEKVGIKVLCGCHPMLMFQAFVNI
ncbi:Mannose-6-phosphate isomerase [Eufriesea mexicana]|uniref:mannose-6-phosphate isomerase n=1 Tax=Eufriesea mexicana TaxID=516756 RepID=A0A310SE35_9HYME|nr:Mannose-6-phosphate isomerase [Eufriesea mexicana]